MDEQFQNRLFDAALSTERDPDFGEASIPQGPRVWVCLPATITNWIHVGSNSRGVDRISLFGKHAHQLVALDLLFILFACAFSLPYDAAAVRVYSTTCTLDQFSFSFLHSVHCPS